LLENGAEKSLTDSYGFVAYDYAVSRGDMELAELLKP
jgi:ankyrin repeat protein